MANCNSSSNTIYLYNGQGANSTCIEHTAAKLKANCKQYTIIPLDASYLQREEAPFLYVLPGGSTNEMGKALESAVDKIRGCVYKGSGILGICAGAMVCSSKWEHYTRMEIPPFRAGLSGDIPNWRLNLGPYATGPAYDAICKNESFFEYPKARLATINSKKDGNFKVWWNCGPVFDLSSLNKTDVVATYEKTADINPLVNKRIKELAAVIHTNFGLGKVVLSGIHPELAEFLQSKGNPITEDDIRSNNLLFNECLQIAGIQSDPS